MASDLTTIKSLTTTLGQDAVKKRFTEILGKKSAGFISSIISATKNNELLQKSDPNSIINSAVMAATLDLPINQNLGMAAVVPYYDSKQKKYVAQFQIMSKGFVELAQRSGQYSCLTSEIVYEGQLVSKNRFTGQYLFDEDAKMSDSVIGYVAYFRLLNGFEKYLYMTKEEVQRHAQKYSKTYQKGFGTWVDNFDAMALKTVMKLLISKFGPKSIDIQRAIIFDQSTSDIDLIETNVEDADFTYVDNESVSNIDELTAERLKQAQEGENNDQ